MNGPRRIVEQAPDDLGAALLLAARRERAPVDARARGAALIDVAVGAAAPGGVGAAAGAAPSLFSRAWILGSVAAIVGVGAISWQLAATEPPTTGTAVAPRAQGTPSAATPTMARTAPPAAPTALQESTLATAATASSPIAPSGAGASSASTVRVAASASTAASASSSNAQGGLAEELRLLDEAMRALRSGDARASLRHLDSYNQRFRPGVLAPEASALRIEALVVVADHPAALVAYRDFAVRNPRSPHRRRLAELVHVADVADE